MASRPSTGDPRARAGDVSPTTGDPNAGSHLETQSSELTVDDFGPPLIGDHHRRGYRAGTTAFSVRTNVQSFADLFADRFRDLRDLRDPRDPRTSDTDSKSDDHGDAGVVFDVVRVDHATHPWGVWRDGEPCETMLSENYVLVHLVWEINRLVVGSVGEGLAVHSAAVAKNGMALIMPGQSHAGKSTLAGWLVAHGWEYLTDELSVIDIPTLRVAPYRRPLGVRPGGPLRPFVASLPSAYEVFGEDEWLVPASTIANGRLAEVCDAVALVFPQYTVGVSSSLTELSSSEALVKLVEQAPTRLTGGRGTFRQLSALAAALPAWDLVFDELDSVSSMLEPLLHS